MASLELGYVLEGDRATDPRLRCSPSNRHRFRVHWGRGTVLFSPRLYFIVPFYAAMQFSLQNVNGSSRWTHSRQIAQAPGFFSALWLSTQLAVARWRSSWSSWCRR